MNRFWKYITLPLLQAQKPKVVVEIGSQYGCGTKLLCKFCCENNAAMHTIDPDPQFNQTDFQRVLGNRFFIHKAMSLEILPTIHNMDVVFVDGDHNWYTVYNELKLISEQSQQDKHPFPVLLMHDVCWPYGRRDLYYNPETIPPEFRNKYEQRGVLPEKKDLSDFGLNSHLFNAAMEGGKQNGVLTAIEDFIKGADEVMHFYTIPAFNGYGILISESRLNQCDELPKFLLDIIPTAGILSLISDLEMDRVKSQVKHITKDQILSEANISIAEKDQAITALEEAVSQNESAGLYQRSHNLFLPLWTAGLQYLYWPFQGSGPFR